VTAWEDAAARAFGAELPTGVVPPPPEPEPAEALAVAAHAMAPGERPPLIVTDRFDLSMIDMDVSGARLLIVRIPRADAMALVHKYNPPVMCGVYERGLADLEKDLQIDEVPRAQLRFGTRLLVRLAPKWNDVHFYLVELEADGHGCCP
jgi:hypothetical protein